MKSPKSPAEALKIKKIMFALCLIATVVLSILVFSPNRARAEMSPNAAISWLSQMQDNGSPATLCAAARYYHDHPGAGKNAAWRLWLKRGIELSKTPQEQAYCEKARIEIEKQEAAYAK